MIVGVGLVVVTVLGAMPPLDHRSRAKPDTSDERLSENAAAAYATWQEEAGFFAAFAVSQDGSAWGWSGEHNSMAAAETNAVARCDRRGRACRVIDRRSDPTGAQTGSAAVQQQLARFRRSTGPGAFAMSENGASYWVAGRGDQAQAAAEALAGCNERRRINQPDYLPDWPCQVIERRGE